MKAPEIIGMGVIAAVIGFMGVFIVRDLGNRPDAPRHKSLAEVTREVNDGVSAKMFRQFSFNMEIVGRQMENVLREYEAGEMSADGYHSGLVFTLQRCKRSKRDLRTKTCRRWFAHAEKVVARRNRP